MLKHTRKDERKVGANGFTLIELLVVIVILGVLAAVVVIAIGQIRSRGEVSACQTEKSAVEAAVALYYDDNKSEALPADRYPDNVAALQAGTDPYLKAKDSKFTFTISQTNGNVTATAPSSVLPDCND